MIQVVVFDLDGVIVDLKECHYHSLNQALLRVGNEFVISHDEHLRFYDGLPTKEKLKMLSRYKGLSASFYDQIQRWEFE